MRTIEIKNLLAAALLGALLLPSTATAADENNHWRLDTSLNLFLAGMSGNVTAKGQPGDVDVAFKDIAQNLEFAAAGRLTARNDRWVLSTEFSYMGLGASKNDVSVDMDQWLVEPSLGYQFCKEFQAFAGVRYNNINGDITGPLENVPTGTQDWWDPIVGAQVSLPLMKDKLTLDGRFDIGGFGAGSDLTWQAFPYLNWRLSEKASLQLGYRWLATDYETGSGADEFRYDVTVQGPQVGLTISL
jgi:hypothetical protein